MDTLLNLLATFTGVGFLCPVDTFSDHSSHVETCAEQYNRQNICRGSRTSELSEDGFRATAYAATSRGKQHIKEGEVTDQVHGDEPDEGESRDTGDHLFPDGRPGNRTE